MPDPVAPETPAVVPSNPVNPAAEVPVIDPPQSAMDADLADFDPDAVGGEVADIDDPEEPEPAAEGGAEGESAETDEPAEAESSNEEPPAAEPAPVDEPAPSEPAAADPPAPPADTEAVRQAQIAAAQAYQQFRTNLTAAREKLADPAKFDAIDDAPAVLKTLADGLDLLDKGLTDLHREQATVKQEQAAAAFWGDFASKNPTVGADRARQLWDAEVKRYAQRGLSGEALAAAATGAWEAKMEVLKGAGKPAAAKPSAPAINRGGARITPKAAGAAPVKPPKPRAATVDEKLEAGKYGNLAEIV